MMQKSQNSRKYPFDSFREGGSRLYSTSSWGYTATALYQQVGFNRKCTFSTVEVKRQLEFLPAVEVKQKLDVTNRYSTGVRLYQQLRLISNWNLPAVEVKKQWDFTSS